MLLSPILRSLEDNRLMFLCPGCNMNHSIDYSPGRWTWNGDINNPTFLPSVLVRYTKVLVSDEEARNLLDTNQPIPHKDMICHSFVVNGQMQFLNDCTHELAGTTVDLLLFNIDI